MITSILVVLALGFVASAQDCTPVQENQRFPYPYDCQFYYLCLQGKLRLLRCPLRHLFNPKTKACDHDYNVNCEVSSTSSTSTTTTTTTTTTTPKPTTTTTTTPKPTTTTTTTPRPTTTTTTTPQPTTTTTTTTTTPEPTTTTTTTTTTPKPTTTPTTTTTTVKPSPTQDGIFDCPEKEGLFPVPTNCQEFYNCFNWAYVKMKCPNGQLFCPERRECDYADRVNCLGSTTRRPIVSSTGGPFRCPEPNGLFPHPTDNTKFITCVNDQPYIEQCPPGLIFKEDRCDWP